MGVQFTPPPPAAVSRILSSFDRGQLAGFIAVAIDLLDLADGDSDIEPNGDDLGDQAFPDDQLSRDRGITGRVTGFEDAEQDDEPEDDDEDCCPAGDDEVSSGTGPLNAGHFFHMDHVSVGNEDDAEHSTPPAYRTDQTASLFVNAENDA